MNKVNMEFNIRQFNINKMKKNAIAVYIGKRGTGKSKLVLSTLKHNQDIPMGTCVSPTEEFNRTFGGTIPEMFIHEEFTPELLEKFVHRQKVITKKKEMDPAYRRIDHRAFLIFDDCLYNAKDWVKDKNMRFIFMNGRHVGITFLLTMQYLLGIPPNLRANIDYIFICKETKTTIKKKLYDYYAGMFPTFEMFNQVLNECTKDYGCMVIDNTTSSDKLEDQVFWFKADITRLKNFRLCDKMFWKAEPRNDYVTDKADDFHPEVDYYKMSGKRNKANFQIHRLSTGGDTLDQNYDFNPQKLYQ